VTYCLDNVAVTDSLMPLRALDSVETAAHEAVHRRQLLNDCDSTKALWSRDVEAKMEAEAEAFCVGMRAAGRSTEERGRRAVVAALWWSQFRGTASFAEYRERFMRWCLP
jgi:hypothetical protein